MNTRTVAEKLGWHFNERNHVISRYPLVDPPGGNGVYVFVEPLPGRVVAVSNVHLPADPYGPYEVRDGATREEVLQLEEELRVPAISQPVRELPKLAARGIPVFLTGDFNTPSHLDWTAAVVDAREDAFHRRLACFEEARRCRLRRLVPKRPPGSGRPPRLHVDARLPGGRAP